jgi:hypothetical protein
MSQTPDEMLSTLRRTCDEGWIEPLLEDPDSRALLMALATIGSRLSILVDVVGTAAMSSQAPTARPGTTIVSIKSTHVTGADTFPQGEAFEDARGVRYQNDADIALPAGPFPLTSFSLRTLRQTESVNTIDDPDIRFSPVLIVADATNATPIVVKTTTPHPFVTGMIVQVRDAEGNAAANGIWTITVIDPDHFSLDTSVGSGAYTGAGIAFPNPYKLEVISSTPTQGGSTDWLSMLGNERGVRRQVNESDASYRARVRNIPDAVSPVGILESINGPAQFTDLPQIRMLEPFRTGATPELLEEIGLGTFEAFYYDNTAVGTAGVPFPYAWDEFGSILLTMREGCAYFQIVPTGNPYEGSYFTGVGAALLGGFATVMDELERKRAACVQYDFFLPGVKELYHQALITTTGGGGDLAWTLTPPTGFVWKIWSLIGAHVKTAVGVQPPNRQHWFVLTFEDATTYTTPGHFGYDTDHNTEASIAAAVGSIKRVTQIQMFVQGPAAQYNAIGALRVIEQPL